MVKVLVIVFCVAAAILAVRGDEIDRSIDKVLRGTARILRQYDEDLDKAVPFRELRESMNILEKMTQTYNGSSLNNINRACAYGRSATNNYFRATDNIYSWCVKGDKVMSNMMRYANVYDKNSYKLVYGILMQTIKSGVTAIDESYHILESVKDDMSTMSNYLRPVPVDLRNELESLKRDLQGRRKRGIFDWVKDTFNKFVDAVKSVVKVILPWVSTVLSYLNLLSSFAIEGLPRDVTDGRRDGTVDENVKILTIYYTKLIDAVVRVQGTVVNVQNAMNKESTYVSGLIGSVEADLEMLNITEMVFDKEQLRELQSTLNGFMSRHSSPSGMIMSIRGENHGFDFGQISSAVNVPMSATYGLDYAKISSAVDAHLKATLKEREKQFWALPNVPVNPGLMTIHSRF